MGGSDEYIWSMETDMVLQKYGSASPSGEIVELPNTPPLSISSPELPSPGSEDDVFFDAIDTLPLLLQPSTPIAALPTSRKLISPSPLPGTVLYDTHSFFYGNLSTWGADLLHSFMMGTNQQHPTFTTPDIETNSPSSSTVIVAPPVETAVLAATGTASTNAMRHMLATSQRLELFFKQFSRHLVRIAFEPNRGVVYWILLYVFLRGPVELLVKTSLTRTSLAGTRRLTTTTIGITAAIAAAMSTSLSSVLGRFKK